jgi:hypothetical protein
MTKRAIAIAFYATIVAGCVGGTPTSPDRVSMTSAPAPAPAPTPVFVRYLFFWVSSGFNRDGAWGVAWGNDPMTPNFRAEETCRQYSRTRACETLFVCDPRAFDGDRPYAAVAREPVLAGAFPGPSAGWACGYSSEAEARNRAMAFCGTNKCQMLWSGSVR